MLAVTPAVCGVGAERHDLAGGRPLSTQLDEVVASFDHRDDLLDQWLEPRQQGVAAGVTDSDPDHGRRFVTDGDHPGEVLVLCDDHSLVVQGVLPQLTVWSVTWADVVDVLRLVTAPGQHSGERWGQLGVDQEAHSLRMRSPQRDPPVPLRR